MMSLMDFFYMNGRGIYVWPAYAIALIILVWNIIIPLLRHKKLMQSISYRIQQRSITEQKQAVKKKTQEKT